MDKELTRLRPANARPTAARVARVPDVPRLPRTEVIEVPLHERQIVMARVHQMARRGEIGPTYRERPTERGWAVQVVRLREPGRRWKRPALVTVGALVVAGAVLWLLALALKALAVALAALVPILLGVLGLVAVIALVSLLAGGSGGGGPVQNNYFR